MEEHWEVSKFTGKKYDLFTIIRILNPKQAAFYSSKGVELKDIEVSADRKTGDPIYVYYFNKNETREAYDLWCKNKE